LLKFFLLIGVFKLFFSYSQLSDLQQHSLLVCLVFAEADIPWWVSGGLQSWLYERCQDQRHPQCNEEWDACC